ncbi:HlyD family secretion protein [Aquamicrobium sp. LC103]|uniref:HlyD family secretion protein n=1 Tax=Aquamicrobium sp. LC103 TaxID=1120658 RepID=UPI00063EC022|nr:HlyD family secretion protein [Aquamicrobium sp. LC103]TKT74858.1 HlyD family secretion protein [Aquamicrobium sp. LC103]
MNAMNKIDEEQSEGEPSQALPAAQPAARKRRGGRYALMLAVPLLLAAGGAYVWVTGGRIQETDNANLRQARVTVAADTPGRVIQVAARDNAQVKAGDVLFVVDPEPYRIALAQDEATLEGARLNVGQLRAAYSQALAQQHNAEGDVAYLQSEFDRQRALQGKGVSTKSSLDQAKRALDQAQDQLQAAREAVTGALAALGGNADIETDRHPTVLAALAARDKAAYELTQTTVRAPADGVISQASSFKVGQYVAAGSPLFSLVETGDSWVEANFKETQLTNMRVGQKAEVTLDTFPGRPLTATVEAIGAGTGAEFSVLPAQNATGNWVKVTQRIPVRLKVEDASEPLLRTGMSAVVSVDTGHARGLPSFAGWFGQTAHAAE